MSTTLEPAVCCAPLAASTLTDEEAKATAELFKALGDPARVRLVNLIARTTGRFASAICRAPRPVAAHGLPSHEEAGGRRACRARAARQWAISR